MKVGTEKSMVVHMVPYYFYGNINFWSIIFNCYIIYVFIWTKSSKWRKTHYILWYKCIKKFQTIIGKNFDIYIKK